jgi:hypothetical protein
VVLFTGRQVYVTSPRAFDLRHYRNAIVAQTDAEGRFSFQPTLGVRKVAIAHFSGFAELALEDLATTPKVFLQAWGRIEGTLQIRGEPCAGESVFLAGTTRRYTDPAKLPAVFPGLETKTDASGRFVLEGVPPGEHLLGHRPSFQPKPGPLPLSHSKVVQVKAGETARVTLGGTGRLIVGKAVLEEAGEKVDWGKEPQRLSLKLDEPPGMPRPKRAEFDSTEAFVASFQAWVARAGEFWNSPEGLRLQQTQRDYVLVFAADGTFRANDVLPGTYELEIDLSGPAETDPPFDRKSMAYLRKEVVVPDEPEGETAVPLDLGTLVLATQPGTGAQRGGK